MTTNDELNKVLIDAINSTKDGVGQAVDFAVAQAPEVIQQLLLWESIKSLSIFIPLIMLCLLIMFLFIKEIREPDDKISMDLCVFLVLLFPCAVAITCTQLTWLKIWIAPKLYLVEYAANLIK